MPYRDRAVWALAVAASVAILIAPALWNGFPLLQWDTGGYLARWYEGTLVPSRAVSYGLMLVAGAPLGFWPVLLMQAALTVWIVALMLRAHGLGGRPLLIAGVVAALSALTTLPWLTAILLTDIFCGLGVLALYLLLLRHDSLSRGETAGLVLLVAVAASTHSATLAVLAALFAAAGVIRLVGGSRISGAALGRSGLALALGAMIVFTTNYMVARQLVWTPGGYALSFGRMLQDGIVNRYLDEHCPDAKLQLCAVKDELPRDADVWFWGSELFDSLGRFAGLGHEMETIARRSLIAYPEMQLRTAGAATLRQIVNVRTGEGVLPSVWHTHGIIRQYTPANAPAMQAARQQKGGISFEAINALHYPLALASLALLPFIVLLGWRRRVFSDVGELAAACAVAVMANAVVCGALSNPHDRYGARLVWLATITAGIAVLRYYEQRQRAPAGDIVAAVRSP